MEAWKILFPRYFKTCETPLSYDNAMDETDGEMAHSFPLCMCRSSLSAAVVGPADALTDHLERAYQSYQSGVVAQQSKVRSRPLIVLYGSICNLRVSREMASYSTISPTPIFSWNSMVGLFCIICVRNS